eukprot:Skav223756  [mRNA]  locus=scaffold3575:525258:528900:- [translate_table: standard]
MLRSGGNARSSVPERLVLPRVMDVVSGARRLWMRSDDLKAQAQAEGWLPENEADLLQWEIIGADLADAFCHFPVSPGEVSNCICPGFVEGEYIVYTALLFGFKAAPLLMARLSSLITRFAQSLLAKAEGVIQTYMDDPLIILAGPVQRRNRTLALLLYSLDSMGVNIAWMKGERGLKVTWIGVVFEVDLALKVLKLTVSAKMLSELLDQLSEWRGKGMVSLKAVRAATGRLSWVAGILPRCRWAVSIMYAVVAAVDADVKSGEEWVRAAKRDSDQRPKLGLVPVTRIALPLEWFVMLLTKPQELLLRIEKLEPDPPALAIITDASPWGVGAVLAFIDGPQNKLTPWVAMDSKVTEEDANWLGLEHGQASSQGPLEAWAILLAVRMFATKLKQYPGDSTVALAMASKLSSPAPAINWVGAELGLRLEHLAVPKLVAHHLPGKLNVVADYLSRPHERESLRKPAELEQLKVMHFSDSKRRDSLLPTPGLSPELWGKAPQAVTGAFDHLQPRHLDEVGAVVQRCRRGAAMERDRAALLHFMLCPVVGNHAARQSGDGGVGRDRRVAEHPSGAGQLGVGVRGGPHVPSETSTKRQNERKPRIDPLHGLRGAKLVASVCGQVKSVTWVDKGAIVGRGVRAGADVLAGDEFLGRAADVPMGGRRRGAIVKALEVASSGPSLQSAVNELTKDFWSSTTVAAREARRAEVLELATVVNGGGRLFPLRKVVVEGVAACLKSAGLTSGFQYLNELKLAHVEAGFSVDAWLVRLLALCKKSMTRRRGPVRRAPELQPEHLEHSAWSLLEASVPRGAWAYAWGVAWMLREVELSNVQWKHVSHSLAQKSVRLFIPHSKMDQQGLGVSRTLQCCGETPCWKGCAWWLWTELVKVRGGRAAEAQCPWMFPNVQGKRATKHEMVGSWKAAADLPVAGHSARRSGAMAYVRRGLNIQELAFLGRWRSAVVLTYAEEALQTVPANRRMAPVEGVTTSDNDRSAIPKGRKQPSTPSESPKVTVPSLSSCSSSQVVQGNGEGLRAKQLWVKSAGCGKSQPLHLVANASWQMAICDWSTSCGWSFAKKSAKVVLVTSPSIGVLKCQKCLELERLRDSVSEGVTPAQLVAGFLDGQSPVTSSGQSTDGNGMPNNRPKRKRVEGGLGCAPRPV